MREAMDLSGHKSGVYSFSFSGDTRRAVTVSKDGTWRAFNIDGWYCVCLLRRSAISDRTIFPLMPHL